MISTCEAEVSLTKYRANLAEAYEVRTQLSPRPINNGVSQYLSFLRQKKIPRNEIFTNKTLLNPFLDAAFTRDIQPIPCHSHNDYLRDVPLFDALNAGCTSIEADIWTDPDHSNDLLVGHIVSALHPARTLKNMFIDPIISILDAINTNTTSAASGLFETSPNTTLVLLIDFKQSPGTLWPLLQSHLNPLRERGYLQYWNETTQTLSLGPVTIIGSGSINQNYSLVQSSSTNTHHDVFLDAPLLALSEVMAMDGPSPFNTSNSYYASSSLNPALGVTRFKPSLLSTPENDVLTVHQTDDLRRQTQTAQNLGLKVRYWETPAWPVGTRNAVWDTLVRRVGVDVLNVDDVWGAARWEWRKCLVGWIGVC